MPDTSPMSKQKPMPKKTKRALQKQNEQAIKDRALDKLNAAFERATH